MQIEDMQVGNRLVPRITAVKAIAADFTERRQGDRVGLILFGTRAYLQAPLTFDLSTVTRFIDEAQLGFAGEDTAIGDALGLAIKRLREDRHHRAIFILLTDGQDTASTVDPMEQRHSRHNSTSRFIRSASAAIWAVRSTAAVKSMSHAQCSSGGNRRSLLPGDLAGRAGGGLRTAR
ncbi:MAG: hypothetical protein CM15mP103_04650 [Gammaproteobacteria bacterium]|nr:MAG: hypothetical protein CM15mP103_04650 [Gammaproteobacteria bacterium]